MLFLDDDEKEKRKRKPMLIRLSSPWILQHSRQVLK